MTSKPLVVLCWIQIVITAAFVVLAGYNNVARPVLQFEYSRRTGVVTQVAPDGAAARGGLRKGDRVITINGWQIGPRRNPMFAARAGVPTPVVIERNGVRQTVMVVPAPYEEAREAALIEGPGRALWAISSYSWFPLTAWMFGLGIFIMAMRGARADARLSALFFIYWSGGNFLPDTIGMGSLLEPLPPWIRAAIYVIDSFFVAMFFAVCVHFAMLFAADEQTRDRRWGVLPYLAALPIFIESMLPGLRRIDVHSAAAQLPSSATIYKVVGPSMLVAALVILGFRYRGVSDLNIRRRMKLVFIALLPGVAGFVLSNILHLFDNDVTNQVGDLINLAGTVAGSALYAYAVVRHRMFGIRVLVRRSIQYALARSTLLALMSLPVVGVALYLYAHRHDSVATVLTGTPALYLLVILPLALVIRYRRSLLEALDRRYFREQYDARQLLLNVVSMIREGSDMIGLSRVALDEIERALHPKHISLWQLDLEGKTYKREFARGSVATRRPQSLAATGALPTLLGTDDEPLDLHERHTRPMVKRFPQPERDWLADSDAYLIVPLRIEERLAGLMVLGERMSEEPYSREDRELLRTLAAQLALTFDYSRLKGSPSLVWASNGTPAPLSVPPAAPIDELRSCPACGRCYPADVPMCEYDQQPLAREEGVPRMIEDKYVVTRLLGRGGMGSVYLATQKRLNRPVAVKVLLSHLVGSSSMRTRFEREARIVARLRHPGIVTIHDFGVLSAGHAYLVMEYLEGQTLRRTIAGGAQPLPQVLALFGPVVDAIEAAHRAGVVHRDLKPENIMIVPDRETGAMSPRVLDFGLAKMTGPIGDDEATIVQSAHSVGIVGTLMYLAPEILSGHPAEARSDQYALGLIAYELLTGFHPFGDAGDLASIVRHHTMGSVAPVRDYAPDLPEFAAAAIHKALSKNVSERFATVGELLAALSGGG